jgi:Xaa-Pro aminopeptidase
MGLSKLQTIPGLEYLSPAVNSLPDEESLETFLQCQRLAFRAVKEVAGLITEGWTERQAAEMVETYLQDSGVKAYFHYPFAWFGERSKFEGMKKYRQALPSERKIREGEVFILDVAPILQNHSCDVGYTGCVGSNPEFDRAMHFLRGLREEIPAMFEGPASGQAIWETVEKKIMDAGFERVYDKYPYGVLGHRIYTTSEAGSRFHFLNMGWQAYWNFASRGVFGQLLTKSLQGDLTGIWAIEPHLGGKGFGAKFEEILVVDNGKARWLETEPRKGWSATE